jgi:phenylalanyl-tRNA synthetase beta chain
VNASYEWLRAFVAIEATPPQLRDLLTAHAATVEELVPMRTDLAPIVVARVVEAARHPDSDHLWVTKVDAGGGQPLLEVICGAPNVTAGKLYPFAPVGTTMPGGIKIERRKIRGIVSNGMLCSARELGLGDDHQGILELTIDAPTGTRFLSVMPVGDTRLVIDVGANRPDLQSHIGFARELTAITGKPWRMPEVPGLGAAIPKAATVSESGETAGIKVRVEADTKTRRYMGAVVRGVKIGPSPEWLVRRLETVGVRSINNVVDATNYVLHELGQPVHAFDAAKIGGGEIIVRKARPKETTVTLDGVTRTLTPDTVIIADAKTSQGIAGVMGGRDSEVTDATRDLFIEVANFDPKLIRAARKAAGLNTDASYRFERGVDREITPVALDRVVRIITALAGGTLDGTPIDVGAPAPPSPVVKVRAKRVAQVLGADVPTDQAKRHLVAAGFEVTSSSKDALEARVPSWRGDVTEEIDLVEEIARFHGYDKLPDEIRPFRPTNTFDDPLWTTTNRVRDAMVALGLLEAHPVPFVAGGDAHVRIANPIAESEAHLRTSILETLSRRAEFNLAQRSGDVRLFEIGSAFTHGDSAMPREQLRLGIIMMGRRRPPHFTEPQPPNVDEWDAKAVAEVATSIAHPDKPVEMVQGSDTVLWQIRVGDRVYGNVTRLALDAPVWAAPAFGLELVLAEVETDPPAGRGKHSYIVGARPGRPAPPKYAPIPTMPPAEIDLALLVPDGTTVADVERVIRASSGELLERLELFDQYTGSGVEAGHRSLAWRLTFRHHERTLRDKEIEGRRAKVVGALQQELNVRQR